MIAAQTVRTGSSARPGITLIEVLLGLAIFLLAIVAVGRLATIGTDSAMDSMFEADGVRLAQSRLAEVEAGAIPASSGGSGVCDEEPAWNWSVESQPTAVPNLYSITVTLSRQVRGRPMQVVLEQMVFDPVVMGTAAQVPNPETGGTSP